MTTPEYERGKKEAEAQWEIPCSDGSHNSFWKTVVISPEWQAWEKESSRRMHQEPIGKCFDVDECREVGWMSVEHFKEFIAFTNQEPLSSFKARVIEALEKGSVVLHIDEKRGDNIGVEERWGTGYNQALSEAINIIKNLE